MSEIEGHCKVCKELCKQKCSQCKLVYYCSGEHQKDDWKNHRKNCVFYEICSNQELGRFLKAKKDLEPGEIIFVDTPLVFGPRPYKIEEGPFPCVGCSKILLNEVHACPECGWPACNAECAGLKSPQRHGLECQILKMRPPTQNQSMYQYFRFDILILLRALFLQKSNKKKWDVLLDLEDHLDERGPNSPVYKAVQEKVSYVEENYINPLKAFEKESGQSILPQVSSDIMHKIYAILDVNATEITELLDLFILYPIASLLEHSCLPNTSQTIDNEDGYKITFRAALHIKQGDHITTTYTNILWGTQERRKHLKETKYFACSCQRCRDPTELGTFFSALICLGTTEEPCKGIQLPVNPTEDHTNWRCNKCGIKLPNKEISDFVSHLSKEVNKIIEKRPNLEELEEFLGKLDIFLHPNHYLAYTIKHTLVQLYKIDDEIEISNSFLDAKLKLCQELIDLTKKLDPGNSRLAIYLAVLLNEQLMTKFKILSRNFGDDQEETSHLKDEVLQIASESRDVLNNEKHSEAGAKLLEVINFNGIKIRNWLEEHEIFTAS
ncbi:SET domain-containing protein SmydA-8 [Dendroctonus ponderosae]|uniref:SET domain-containing protein SmydA-8 n=1 Tax=Dendroctonus ponderosae TaxID=77166 RepID=UPI002034FE32|nr:SET domain-containing protein SmydA-8 [Dendroctonus ponderosae]XP_048519459.1 SET domain-containing protein SmydA-8 [Dendroctonus ponderosae]KAH1025142.1 hypothetical protein HUJ05_009925 [Dendroctonus ponderosae]KAH1025143.1 hypothetical protein HUJ05_009925 [Dendroctonus ponderosae]